MSRRDEPLIYCYRQQGCKIMQHSFFRVAFGQIAKNLGRNRPHAIVFILQASQQVILYFIGPFNGLFRSCH
jgi:hypothetical protein